MSWRRTKVKKRELSKGPGFTQFLKSMKSEISKTVLTVVKMVHD